MTALAKSIEISEYAHVTFTVLDENNELLEIKGCKFEEAFEHIKRIFYPSDMILITDIVASRSIVILNDDSRHEHTMCHCPGKFTSEQFLKMMHYEKGISNEAWFQHLKKVIDSQHKE